MDNWIYKDESYKIVGCAMEVHNILGCGLLEKPYENALIVELSKNNIPFIQQPKFTIDYKGTTVGEYIPDIIANDKIILEIKSISKITNNEIAQTLNYLKITNLKLGIILNFKNQSLEYKRILNN